MNRHHQGGKHVGSAAGTAALLAMALVGAIAKSSRASKAGPPPPDGSGGNASRTRASVPPPDASTPVPVAHKAGIIGFGQAIVARISRDNIMLVAAGIAFYIMLSIFPALGALVSLYGLVGNPADVAARIGDYGSLLPPEALKLITDGLNSFAKQSGSQLSLALAVSVVVALWSARAGTSSVMTGLNIAYEETEKRSFVVQVLVALALTVGAVVFAVLAILALAVVPIVLKFLSLDNTVALLINIARWPALALLVVLGLAVVYRWAPSRSHPRWRWITWGSAVATALWLIGSFGFSFYVGHFGSYDATYGSLGAVVILLLWLWVSALIMLFGAEIDSELDVRDTLAGSPLAGTAPSAGPPVGRGKAPAG